MFLNLLLPLAVTLEIGFLVWYIVMLIALWRSETNGLTQAMVWLTISYILNTLWLIGVLFVLPERYIALRIPLDIFKAIMVTYFMWELDIKERIREWREKE